jgi:hypothetical protein
MASVFGQARGNPRKCLFFQAIVTRRVGRGLPVRASLPWLRSIAAAP